MIKHLEYRIPPAFINIATLFCHKIVLVFPIENWQRIRFVRKENWSFYSFYEDLYKKEQVYHKQRSKKGYRSSVKL